MWAQLTQQRPLRRRRSCIKLSSEWTPPSLLVVHNKDLGVPQLAVFVVKETPDNQPPEEAISLDKVLTDDNFDGGIWQFRNFEANSGQLRGSRS
jgi:hypothetical protein